MKYSVVIPVYNKADTIKKAIDSILAQTIKDYEIIIVDDGSVDNLMNVLLPYTFINLIHQQNSGVSVARNTGIKMAKGEYICFLDADDIWFSNHLEILNFMIKQFPKEQYFCTSHVITDTNGHEIHTSDYLRKFSSDVFVCNNLFQILNDYSDTIIHTNSICINRKIFMKENLFFQPKEKIGEDTDLWFRIALRHPIVISKQETTIYRRENSTATRLTSNTFTWIFAKRLNDIMRMEDVSQKVKISCVYLVDRYKMTCSREYMLLGNRKEAQLILKTVYNHSMKLYLTKLFCQMPQRICQYIYLKYIGS